MIHLFGYLLLPLPEGITIKIPRDLAQGKRIYGVDLQENAVEVEVVVVIIKEEIGRIEIMDGQEALGKIDIIVVQVVIGEEIDLEVDHEKEEVVGIDEKTLEIGVFISTLFL